MTKEQIENIRTIRKAMEEGGRPAVDENDVAHLNVLIRLTVQFRDYLDSLGSSGDLDNDTNYLIEALLWNLDSFTKMMHLYGILVGATTTTIDWNGIRVPWLKEKFISIYDTFVAEANFENKFRLLLDLVKLQIVFAGVLYDCG